MNKCSKCGKEIEKPYIMCEECHDKYLGEIVRLREKPTVNPTV